MIKGNYILFILLTLVCYHSCLDNKGHNNQLSDTNEKYISDRDFLETYFSTIDIPYLLEEDKDSILSNKEEIKNNVNYRNQFIGKARGRKSAIRKFHFTSYNGKKVPVPFKRYLLPNELDDFNKDSLSGFIKLYELYRTREKEVNHLVKNINYLKEDEIQKLIEGSFKDSSYYKELAFNRFEKDSVTFWTAYNKRKDSLQSIIYPVDSVLPFGPKALGNLIEQDKNYLGFYIKEGDSISEKNKKKRKDIYEIWTYYLKLYPYVDADLSEDYEEKLLPPIKDYKILENPFLSILEQEGYVKRFNPIDGSFVTRLSNINNYEVYYATTGVDYPKGCGAYSKKIEDCCFFRAGYDCNSEGYVILYDHKDRFATVIPVFILNNTQSYGFQLQFSYIKDNVIYIYQGYSMYDRFVNQHGDWERYKVDAEGNTISAKGYKSVGIAKAYEIKILNNDEVRVTKINK